MSKPPSVTWYGVNADMYQANLSKKVGRIDTYKVAGFAYINNVGRVQYTYDPVVVWSSSRKELEKIVANSCSMVNELDPIDINGDG